MITWTELEGRFRDLSGPLQFARLDAQWGAAGEHWRIAGGADRLSVSRFEATARIAGEKLKGALVAADVALPEVTGAESLVAWYKGIQVLTEHFRLDVVAEQRGADNEFAGHIFAGTADRPADVSALLCLQLLHDYRDAPVSVRPTASSTRWPSVERCLSEADHRLRDATAEEQFQAVGLLCREALISVAQAVYVPQRDITPDGVAPSTTDAKRMFDAFIRTFRGDSDERLRKLLHAVLDLAVELQHRRTATEPEAALCLEASRAAVRFVSLLENQRERGRG